MFQCYKPPSPVKREFSLNEIAKYLDTDKYKDKAIHQILLLIVQ